MTRIKRNKDIAKLANFLPLKKHFPQNLALTECLSYVRFHHESPKFRDYLRGLSGTLIQTCFSNFNCHLKITVVTVSCLFDFEGDFNLNINFALCVIFSFFWFLVIPKIYVWLKNLSENVEQVVRKYLGYVKNKVFFK